MRPRIVMTLLVRDEEDVVYEWLRYHYARGVDFVIATDHGSVDGTTDLLRAEERAGRLRLIRRPAETLGAGVPARWVTEMARLAAGEHRADWVLNSDADELWWPRGGDLADILSAVPPRFGVVRAVWRNFVLRPDDERSAGFAERMTHRRRSTSDLTSPYHGQVKIAHRADPGVVVGGGNHDAHAPGRLLLLRELVPLEVLHFPLRTAAQARSKFARRGDVPAGRHIVHARALLAGPDGGWEAYLREHTYDDGRIAAGEASGELIEDVRLRDALRALDAGVSTLPAWMPTLADELDLALDFDAVLEHDARLRLDPRAAALERSLDRLERLVSARLARRLGRGAQSSA